MLAVTLSGMRPLSSAPDSAMEQAVRLTNPSPTHPATGDAPQDPSSPTVVWREYWDIRTRRPFYHNLVTHETTYDIPKGFPTRFGEYYARLYDEATRMGLNTDEHQRAKRVAEVSPSPLPRRTLRDQLLDYGPSGLGLYLIIHFVGFIMCFGALQYGIDLHSIAASMGVDMPPPTAKTNFGAHVIGAVALNKLMAPLHVGITIVLAPRLTPVVKYWWKRFVYFNQ